MDKRILKVYELLFEAYGHQDWWPADTPWEVCMGAVLTQNTSWTNVEKAIANFKSIGAMTADKVLQLEDSDIEQAIRPSGYFRIKTRRLRSVANWWIRNSSKVPSECSDDELLRWRHSLLEVHGVGEETADSILLYCFNLPMFVIDTYTRRMVHRHLGMEPNMNYGKLQRIFMESIPRDTALYNEFHALIVLNSKVGCPNKKCLDNCPLRVISE
ncbi:endonuclease III domain-containing protein [Lentisphaerota bacterium ZTH]|nr:endonuclease III domain-containing protein [Lentisphaerota bacterium]WET07148.1 endonuclease III domain-containing protein [Lentisphaerota bacterium ZTH]